MLSSLLSAVGVQVTEEIVANTTAFLLVAGPLLGCQVAMMLYKRFIRR